MKLLIRVAGMTLRVSLTVVILGPCGELPECNVTAPE